MTEEQQENGRSRQHDAVLVCLATADGPMTTDTIMSSFVKVGSSRRFEPKELEALLGELKGEKLVEELNAGFYRITGQGRTELGPLIERPLSEI